MRVGRAARVRGLVAIGAMALVAGLASAALGTAPVRGVRPAMFRVGAAVEGIDPTYPVYLGGYGGGPAGGTIARHMDLLTGRPEHLTVRAIAIAQGRSVVELLSVDTQGIMAGYDECACGLTDARQDIATWLSQHGAPGTDAGHIIIGSRHEHAVPTLFGVWAPMSHQVPYLEQVSAAMRKAGEDAYLALRPATLDWGNADAPWLGGGDIGEANEVEGWPRDGYLLALRARDAHTGATIATYVSEPAYPNIVYGPQDLVPNGARKATQISPDFPPYADELLSRQLGGVSIFATSTLSNQASPQQADSAPSPDLPPVDGQRQTRGFDDVLLMAREVSSLAEHALAHGQVVTDPTVSATEQHVISPIDNPAVVALNYLDSDAGARVVGTVTQDNIYPVARATKPPYAYGAAIGTWVTALRIGTLLFLSEPGELSAPIHDTWRLSIPGADAIAAVGGAQDFLGYDYPAYTTPFTVLGGDELIFGPAVTFGDQIALVGQQEARALGFAVDVTTSPELTATDNAYPQMARPGVHLQPGTVDGDALARGWRVRFQAASQIARTQMRCSNPALLFVPPGCTTPEDTMGPFHWTFGDGTSLDTPVQARVRAFFSPFVEHTYTKPGQYVVTVSAAESDGARAMTYGIVTIHPAPRVVVRRSGGTVRVALRGGDGVLAVSWHRADGRTSHLDAVPSSWAVRGTRVTVVDGTGTAATATVR